MKVPHGQFGEIDIPGFSFKFSDTKGSIRMAAPGLGEHSRLVLEEWPGYSPDAVDKLYTEKIVL